MDFATLLFATALKQTGLSLLHNWPYLLVSILVAALLKVLMDAERVTTFLERSRGIGVLAATAAAVTTPLCSCGTTAVVLGMMASTLPWAPIVAFMVASPLSSPEGLVYSAGLFGWPFAVCYFLASLLLGLSGGAAAALLQRMGFLEDQLRFPGKTRERPSCGCAAPREDRPAPRRVPVASIAAGVVQVSKTILPLFLGFAFLGYLLNGLIPASAITALFGAGRAWGVPLAATIGLPLYINSEASVPFARALLDSGMSPGAIMAFLIAGSGTSLGAVAGALTIARWRIVALVAAVLWLGAIAVGYGYNGLLALGLFGPGV